MDKRCTTLCGTARTRVSVVNYVIEIKTKTSVLASIISIVNSIVIVTIAIAVVVVPVARFIVTANNCAIIVTIRMIMR